MSVFTPLSLVIFLDNPPLVTMLSTPILKVEEGSYSFAQLRLAVAAAEATIGITFTPGALCTEPGICLLAKHSRESRWSLLHVYVHFESGHSLCSSTGLGIKPLAQ